MNLGMSRADIANYLGLVPETISRVFSSFERKGMITVKKKKLQIIDIQMLSEYSGNQCHSLLAADNEGKSATLCLVPAIFGQ